MPTSARCSPTTGSRSPSSTSRGGGFRARPTCTFPRRSTPRSCSRTTRRSSSGSPKRWVRDRSTRSTCSEATGRSTTPRPRSPGSATARPSTACSCTSSSCRGRASPTSRRRGRSCGAPTGRTGGVLVDAWHFFRSGADDAALRAYPAIGCSGSSSTTDRSRPSPTCPPRRSTSACCRAPASSTCAVSCARCATSARSPRSASRCSPTSCTAASSPGRGRRRAAGAALRDSCLAHY